MNKDILRMLMDSKNEYVSGQYISGKLGITRAAIWKRMNKLKELGFEIDSVTKKGYKLISYPDIMNKDLIEAGLDNDLLTKHIIVLDDVDSTNDYSKKIAKNMPDGSIVIADEQLSGKGRRGRSFYSGKGEGIYLSFILKPDLEPSKAPFLTSIAAAALIKALKDLDVDVKVKWPNDIIINSKKMCGILTEMTADVESIEYIILGIGINVKGTSFPDEIKDVATSLKIEGYEIKRLDLLWKLITHFEILYRDFVNGKTTEILDILKENSCVLGKDITVYYSDRNEKAKAIDINDEGALVVQLENNIVQTLNSGEISIR